MLFGLTMEKVLLILLLVSLLIGPERLPTYAESLKGMIRKGRDLLASHSQRAKEELGEDFKDVDWRSLDPRRYDPRRIIRSALLEDDFAPRHNASTPESAPRVASSAPTTEPTDRVRAALPAAMMPKSQRELAARPAATEPHVDVDG